jgi:hypothetical protein
MPWDTAARRANVRGLEGQMFAHVQRLAEVRRGLPQMSAGGELTIHRYPDTAVLSWARNHPRYGRFLGLANVSGRAAIVPALASRWAGLVSPRFVLGRDSSVASGEITLAPYEVLWIVDDADQPLQPPPGAARG